MTKFIAHLTPVIGINSYGVGNVVLNLAAGQGRTGWETRIWCVSNGISHDDVSVDYGLTRSRIETFQSLFGPKLLYSPAMERMAKCSTEMPVLVHQHSLWTALSRVTNIFRSKRHIPVVISPHGTLHPWARSKSWWKKSLATVLYERSNLEHASCIHALSHREADDIRNCGLVNPIAVIPNGISKQWIEGEGNAARFRTEFTIPHHYRIALFLSRISPIKGIPMLLKAIHHNRGKIGDWMFVFAGHDEFDHLSQLKELVAQYGIEDHVRFIGLVQGAQKHDAFAASELFILPSYSEGSPIAVLEAMAKGVPVLVTEGTPMPEITDSSCGWRVEACVDAITDQLSNALQTSPEDLSVMGNNARKVILESYTWEQIVKAFECMYQWILYNRSRPSFLLS